MSNVIRLVLTLIIIACAIVYIPVALRAGSWFLVPVWTAAFASGIAALWYRAESRAAAQRFSAWAVAAFLFNASACLLLFQTLQDVPVWARILFWLPFYIGMLAGFAPRYKRRFVMPFDEKEHYAVHQAEIDALHQAYQLALVDEYGFHASHIRAEYASPKASDLVRGHYDEQTADELARVTFNRYYRSKNANNPAIFARHMVTDKPLPSDYPYDSWMQKIGQTLPQQIMRIVFLPLMFVTYCGFVLMDFVVNEGWGEACIVWSVLCASFMTLWLKYSAASGRGGIQLTTPFTPAHFMRDLWVFCWLVAAFWLASIAGVAVLGNALIGETQERTYSYRMGINTRACLPYVLYIESRPVFGGGGKICVTQEVFRANPRQGWVKVTGKASWFGMQVDTYELGAAMPGDTNGYP